MLSNLQIILKSIVFIIDKNKCLNQHIRMISGGSCDTEGV